MKPQNSRQQPQQRKSKTDPFPFFWVNNSSFYFWYQFFLWGEIASNRKTPILHIDGCKLVLPEWAKHKKVLNNGEPTKLMLRIDPEMIELTKQILNANHIAVNNEETVNLLSPNRQEPEPATIGRLIDVVNEKIIQTIYS